MAVSLALEVAINLHLMPAQSRLVRKAPLPDGVADLLRIAAGDEDVIKKAALATDRPKSEIEKAASFFIENILLAPNSDYYRVLGVDKNATSSELRRNMALITRFLHPDLDRVGDRSIYITRVTTAWNELKTPQKRSAYDRQRKDAGRINARNRPTTRRTPKRTNGVKSRAIQSHPKKNSPVQAQPLSRARRGRGAVLRHLTLLLMRITGR